MIDRKISDANDIQDREIDLDLEISAHQRVKCAFEFNCRARCEPFDNLKCQSGLPQFDELAYSARLFRVPVRQNPLPPKELCEWPSMYEHRSRSSFRT